MENKFLKRKTRYCLMPALTRTQSDSFYLSKEYLQRGKLSLGLDVGMA